VTTQAHDDGTIGHSDLVSPIEDLVSILHPFWDQYAQLREEGRTEEDAVSSALERLLSPIRFLVLTHMLAGTLDSQLSTIEVSFDGCSMLAGLISSGERYWQRTRPPAERSGPSPQAVQLAPV
jgi:hypothetical protein